MTDDFKVCTYSILEGQNSTQYVHWSEGLKMVIQKNGLIIELTSEEIEEIVKSLPKTIGGKY